METHWEHRSDYYFFTTNCATETKDSLQQMLSEKHPFQKLSSITPNGVKDDIIEAELIINKDEFPHPQSLFYEGKNDRLERMFQLIAPYTDNRYKSFGEYLSDSDFNFKYSLFQRLSDEGSKKLTMAMAFLESTKKSSLKQDIYDLINENVDTQNSTEKRSKNSLYDYGIPLNYIAEEVKPSGLQETMEEDTNVLPKELENLNKLIYEVKKREGCLKEALYLGQIKAFKLKSFSRIKLKDMLSKGQKKFDNIIEELSVVEKIYGHILVGYLFDLKQSTLSEGNCELSSDQNEQFSAFYQEYFL